MNGNDTVYWKKINLSNWVLQEQNEVNRAFLFGDGLFETMIYQNGKICFGELHYKRLIEGCGVLGLSTEGLSTIEEIQRSIFLEYGESEMLRVRWNVFRAGKGKYTPHNDDTVETLQLEKFIPVKREKQSAFIHPEIYLSSTPWSHCKTLNALPYVIANRDREKLGMEDVILLGQGSFLSEAGAANLFWMKSNIFYTPSLSTGCIDGIGRKVILETLKKEGYKIEEGYFRLEDLFQAETVFTSNVTGISYLRSLEGKTLKNERIYFLEKLFERV